MDSPDASNWAPQSPDLSSYHSASADVVNEPAHPQHQGYRGSISHTTPYSPPTSSPRYASSKSAFMPRGVKRDVESDEYSPIASSSPVQTRRGKKQQAAATAPAPAGQNNGAPAAPSSSGSPSSDRHIEVKTKFPVARIKRIMQADDDVGKVAQVTPVVVSKALELFMISLVTKAAAEAKARSSKRVTAAHLKQAVQKDEQFDFLSDIVAKVADAPAASEKHDGDPMDIDGGKKRKGGGRKKKRVDDDDD